MPRPGGPRRMGPGPMGGPPPPPPRRGWGRPPRYGCMPGCITYVLGALGMAFLLVIGIAALF